MATSETQLKAIKNYQKGKSRIILWYPDAEKKHLVKEMKRKGLLPREIFELGLTKAGIALKTAK